MKLATSTGDFMGYLPTIADCIEFLGSNTQFKYVNLEQDVYNDRLGEEGDEGWKSFADAWGNAAAKSGASLVVSHAPCVNVFGKNLDEETYEKNLLLIRNSLKVCGELGIKRIVVHACPHVSFTGLEFMKKNKEFYSKLFDLMEKYELTVMTENMDSFTYNPLSTGREVREFAEFVDHPLFGVCWDIAHANNNQKAKKVGQYDSIMAIGDKLKGLHVADNFGDGPHHHTWPFAGIVNFDSVLQALCDVKYDGYFTFEASYTLLHSRNMPYHRQPWEHNGETVTTLLNPPIELKRQAVDLLYNVGKYLLETYDCFEE